MLLVATHLAFAICMSIMIITYCNEKGFLFTQKPSLHTCTYYRALHDEISLVAQNNELDLLFSRAYLFPFFLSLVYLCLSVSLLFLFGDQCYNICANITTNERINGHRYAYLLDAKKNFVNRF